MPSMRCIQLSFVVNVNNAEDNLIVDVALCPEFRLPHFLSIHGLMQHSSIDWLIDWLHDCWFDHCLVIFKFHCLLPWAHGHRASNIERVALHSHVLFCFVDVESMFSNWNDDNDVYDIVVKFNEISWLPRVHNSHINLMELNRSGSTSFSTYSASVMIRE